MKRHPTRKFGTRIAMVENSNYSARIPENVFEPLSLRFIRSMKSAASDDSVYYYLHLFLLGRSVVGHPCLIHPKAKDRLRAEGWSACELERVEQSALDHADAMPKWEVARYVPRNLFQRLKKDGRENLIFEHGIVPVPTPIENGLICDRLAEMFSTSVLLATPGFIEKQKGELEDDKGVREVRLDLEPWLCRQGFMIPIIETGAICSFKVFRRPTDEYPFTLRSREVFLHA